MGTTKTENHAGDTTSAPDRARAALQAWRDETRTSLWERTPLLRLALLRHAPALLAEEEAEIASLATVAAEELDALGEIVNRDENLPRLVSRDGLGHPVEDAEFHPAYHRLGEVAYGCRSMADYEKPGRELVQLAKTALLAALGEIGHLCPLACTAGLIKILQRVGDEDLKTRYLPGLLDPDARRNLVGAQFVTEIQGGSDVGLGAVTAEADPDQPGTYRIHGEKWFCSVAHADLFLVTARVPGQGDGTAGLGCFLVPRRLPDGALNDFRIYRFKGKVGTRAFPTAEIEWHGARGWPIGPLEDGFKNVVGTVLQTSRVANAVGCIGASMRAWLDADAYARHRVAFGRPIRDFPSTQRVLSRMKARTWAAVASTFHVIALSEKVATGEGTEDDRAALRMLTNANKYGTSVQNTRTVIEGIEVLGGNGTIEEFTILPRLLRDAVVFESWEGTHNVLCAQMLRDATRYGMHEPMLAHLAGALDALGETEAIGVLRGRLDDLRTAMEALPSKDPVAAQDAIRPLVDEIQFLLQGVALAGLAETEASATGTDEAARVLEVHLALHPPGFATPPEVAPDRCL